MQSQKNYENMLKWVEQKALKLGADAIRSVLNVNSGFSMSQRNDSIEKMEESIQSSLRVEIFKDNRYSYHSTNDLNQDRLESFLDKAVSMTSYLEKDEARRLPDPALYPVSMPEVDLDLVDPTLSSMTIERKKKLLNRLVQSAYAKNSQLISVTGEFWNGHSHVYGRASNGFSGTEEKTYVGMSVEVSMNEPGGRKPEDWKSVNARHFDDLWDPEEIAAEAVKRVEQKLGAEKITSGIKTMIVENTAVARLLYPIIGALTGKSLYQKRSFLDGMMDHQVGSDLLTLRNDPFIPRGLGSRYFDEEGIRAQKRTLFDKGILKNYFIDSYYGNKLGMDPTSGSFSNLILNPGSLSPEELIKNVSEGIYVTQFIGGNSNSNTGDFSYGVMGHEIRDGKLVRPVTEMNISGNYLELMKSLHAVGNDPYIFSSFRMPTLVFKNVNFAGK
ncbi:MAG TPA: TldD/PmbA family protein [Candidatus Marinimicrobia bacterium]|nr:TldD/PmbA family protein [Candidatus Neomarinimicrobiota bacterium]